MVSVPSMNSFLSPRFFLEIGTDVLKIGISYRCINDVSVSKCTLDSFSNGSACLIIIEITIDMGVCIKVGQGLAY